MLSHAMSKQEVYGLCVFILEINLCFMLPVFVFYYIDFLYFYCPLAIFIKRMIMIYVAAVFMLLIVVNCCMEKWVNICLIYYRLKVIVQQHHRSLVRSWKAE